jgi:hypothetical protein
MGSKQTSTSRADPWKPTQGGLKGIIGDAADMYASGGFQVNPYGGQWVADRNDMTTSAQSGLAGLIPGLTGANSAALGTLGGIADGSSYDAMKRNVTGDVMSAVNGTFAGSGMTGSTLHQQNLAKGLASGLGGLEMQAANQQMQAAGMMPGVANAAMDPYRMLAQFGADQQGYDQSVIDAAMKKDLMGQTAGVSALQDYAQLLSGIGGQFGTQTNTQKQNMGLGGMLGLGLQMFSDVRLKENVRRIGTADNGLPLYAYRYRGSPATHVGVMAQEVQDVMPEAVGEAGGYLTVDYGAIFPEVA